MTYDKFLKCIKKENDVIELKSSPLLRNDNSYFTFSPYQDTKKNFLTLNDSNYLYVKFQNTIRRLDNLNLTNPLNLNYQSTYSIQNYKKEVQLYLIEKLISMVKNNFFPELNDSDVEITYPDTLNGYFEKSNKKYNFNEVPMSDRYFSKLGLDGNHYYVKVRFKYRTGSINVVDFVLVDYDPEEKTSMLDSIWVEDLIDLINENVPYIFDEKKYKKIKKIVKKYTDEKRDQHVLLNDLRVIFKMLSLGVNPGAKGINSEVRRKIRKFYFYCLFYVQCKKEDIEQIITDFGNEININDEIIDIFASEIRKISKNYKKSIKFVSKNNINRVEAQSSFGIPNEYYGEYLQNWHSEYDF